MIVSGKEAWKRNVLNADGRLTETGQIAYHVVRQDVPEESLAPNSSRQRRQARSSTPPAPYLYLRGLLLRGKTEHYERPDLRA